MPPADAQPCAGELTGPIPGGAYPCSDEQYWPLHVISTSYPITVHFSQCSQQAGAEQVLSLLEVAWTNQVEILGITPPVDDGGACGDDGDFDVYLWPGQQEAWVEAVADDPETEHDDWKTFMALDPDGPWGGPLLPITLAHELNHACQAADDWWDSTPVFEMTATFIEEVVYPSANDWFFTLEDFQAHPDWSLDRNDDYATWYMYGSALYLHFLRKRYFAGDARFIAGMWQAMRNPPGHTEPDFEDAIDSLLQAGPGVSFFDSVVEFAVWRWYTGSRDDGAHFDDGAVFPSTAEVALAATLPARPAAMDIDPAPMLLGNAYIEIVRGAGDPDRIDVMLTNQDVGVEWVAQVIPGMDGSDGQRIDIVDNIVTIDLSSAARRTLVLTTLPIASYDADARDDTRYHATLVLQ